jgi:branched-subunit amino acid ABC-type transport system permease component
VQGALIGGIVYGIVEAFATQINVTIGTQTISGSGLQDAIALIALLIVLIVRPTGIMGKATA